MNLSQASQLSWLGLLPPFSPDLRACGVGSTSGEKAAKAKDEVDFKDISIEEAYKLLEVRRSIRF